MGLQTQHPESGEDGDNETVASLTVTGLTASRLVATDGSKTLASVASLSSWVSGTSNQLTVTDDGDGTVTLSLPSAVTMPGSLTVTTQILVASGSVLVPGLGFSAEPDTGPYLDGLYLSWAKDGVRTIDFFRDRGYGFIGVQGNALDEVPYAELALTLDNYGATYCGMALEADGKLLVYSTGAMDLQAASNVVEIKNAATAQTIRVYGTTGSGGRYVSLSHDGVNGATLGTSQGAIVLAADNGEVYIQDVGVGNLYGFSATLISPLTPNTRDVGDSTNSFRAGYFGTFVGVGSSVASGGHLRLGNQGIIRWRNAADNEDIGIYLTSGDVISSAAGTVYPTGVVWHVAAGGELLINASGIAFSNHSTGFFGTAPVAQRVGGVTLTNNVTAGGTTNQLDDFTSLTVYATDAAAIRNNIYQLGRKLKLVTDAVRTLGLLQNADA